MILMKMIDNLWYMKCWSTHMLFTPQYIIHKYATPTSQTLEAKSPTNGSHDGIILYVNKTPPTKATPPPLILVTSGKAPHHNNCQSVWLKQTTLRIKPETVQTAI